MNGPADEDGRLAARLASGDVEAARALYDRYAPCVLALARRILREERDAEDVAQEVFAQAWRSASRFDVARGNLASWLLVMTRSRAIDRLRSRKARPDTVGPALPDTLSAPDPQPEATLLATEQADRVREALARLPPPQREALELAYFQGLTQSEIAAFLAEPLGTVKTRIRAALLALRGRLRA